MSRRTVLLAAIACAAIAVLPIAGASAAEYTVITCAGQPAGVGGWGAFTGGSFPAATGENCGSAGGAMVATLRGNTSSAPGNAGWQTFAPAGTTIAGATLYRSVTINGGSYYDYIARGVTPAAAATYPTIETCSGSAPCKALSAKPSVSWRAPRGDVNRIQIYVQCAPPSGTANCAQINNAIAATERITRVDLALSDTSVPAITAGPSSSMFDSPTPVSGVQTITASFQDAGGGIAATGIQVDGQVNSEQPVSNSTCRPPYRTMTPCPASVATRLQFNPAGVPDGPHQIRVYAKDATGANVGFSKTFTVTTSARGAVNGTNGSDQVKLTVRARKVVKAGRRAPAARSSTVTVGYGHKAVVSGSLHNAAGQPVVGARLSVQSAVDRGVPQYASIPVDVVTSSTGSYKFVVPPGPSRRVRIAYFARALDTSPAAQGDGRMKVTTRVSAHAVHRSVRAGSRARFRGRIAGRYRPPGVRVELQGRRGRHSWVTLSTADSRPDGTYSVSYRFTGRARGRYVFRIRVRHYARFPYFLGYSSTVNVTAR